MTDWIPDYNLRIHFIFNLIVISKTSILFFRYLFFPYYVNTQSYFQEV